MILQAPRAAVMIRPHHFTPNADTTSDNSFQSEATGSAPEIATRARAEFDQAVATLRDQGVSVMDFDDKTTETPDSVFPNNWFSTHTGGHIAVYPMFAKTRRRERRWDIIETLKRDYRVQDVIDYSGLEMDNLALEGTGAMVLDHINRIAFVARSNRADPIILERFCTNFNFEPIVFDATDNAGRAVYHTNVLMAICTEVAMVGLSMIRDAEQRASVADRLIEDGRALIDLSEEQINAFCGNALELTGKNGRFLALSSRAAKALTPAQRDQITAFTPLVPLDIPTIETAGGSVRCMIAGIHLAKRQET